jgi:Flp pilus assembly protein TadB
MVIMVPMVAWEPGLFPWLIVPILLTGVINMGVAALAQRRRGELESFDAMIEVGLAVAVVAFLVALVVGLPPPLTAALPVVALSLGFVFALRIKREMKHMTRGFDVMVADLRDQLGDES